MEKFGKSQPVKRVEDVRFLLGTGRYVDDIAPAGAFYALFLRSPVAHATITRLDLTDAREAPGVKCVLKAEDCEAMGIDLALSADLSDKDNGNQSTATYRPFLAKDRVNFVGEALAIVVAETLDQARDAIELIEFEFDELEP
ncbi:MAG: xanthine dehydrogenase family protein molybdopterin-binding subunit, partial [Deltaproteobacteria bacterium]